mmetsp:Transcript_13729/g.37553  ORF Transcript_13729/g.37553 Transcript_13729/m.37553 type:complete len:83 (-) Transcript_13729:387-635(-)
MCRVSGPATFNVAVPTLRGIFATSDRNGVMASASHREALAQASQAFDHVNADMEDSSDIDLLLLCCGGDLPSTRSLLGDPVR